MSKEAFRNFIILSIVAVIVAVWPEYVAMGLYLILDWWSCEDCSIFAGAVVTADLTAGLHGSSCW